MRFLIPAGFWGLIGAALIILIYIFQRRYRPLKVSAIFLWESVFRKRGGGYKLSKIEHSLIFFLELLIAALLAFALASPGCRYESQKYKIIFVLDDSVSMSATDGKSSARDRAVDEILLCLQKHSPFNCSIILANEETKMLVSGVSEIQDIERILRKWQPRKIISDINSALDFAFQVAGESACVICVSDSAPPKDEEGKPILRNGLVWHSFGKKSDNCAFVSASRKASSTNDKKEDIFAEIANYSPEEKEISLRAEGNGVIYFERKIRASAAVSSNASSTHLSVEIPASQHPLTLSVVEKDALTEDNSVILFPEPITPVRVAVKIPSGDEDKILRRSVEKAITALGNEALVVNSEPHLVIVSGKEPPSPLSASDRTEFWELIFPSPGQGKKRSSLYGPYLINKDSPVVENLNLEGVKWTLSSDNIVPDAIVEPPLISYGKIPLLYELPSSGGGFTRKFIMNYNTAFSNLHKTYAWPFFFHNLIREKLKSIPGLHRKNYRLGEKISFRAPFPNVSVFSSDFIGGKKTEKLAIFSDNDGFVCFKPDISGVCEIRYGGKDEDKIAVNFFSSEESNLWNLESGIYGKQNFEIMSALLWKNQSWIFLLLALLTAFARTMLIKKEEEIA
jgi:hypothetical protein